MSRTIQIAIATFILAAPAAFAQGAPSPLPAPVGHRQPTASDFAPAVSPNAVEPMQSGRSVKRGKNADMPVDTDAGPRICTNCDD